MWGPPYAFNVTLYLTAGILAASWRKLRLHDVVLFVATTDSLQAVDPFTGSFEYEIGALSSSGSGFGDIAFRNDGNLFGFTRGANDANAGNYNLIDSGTAAETS